MDIRGPGLKSIWKLISKIFIFSSVSALLLHALFFTDANLFLKSDFLSFLTGARILSQGNGGKLYDIQTQLDIQKEIKAEYKSAVNPDQQFLLNNVLPYRNLPFVAFLFIPFLILPGLIAYKLFTIINIVLLIIFLIGIKKIYSDKISLEKLILISLVFLPVLTGIYRGQLTLISLYIYYLILVNIKAGKSFCAGVLGGLLLVKIQYLFAIPLLIIASQDYSKFTKGFLLTAGILLSVSFLLTGQGFISYPAHLLLTEEPRFGSYFNEIITLFSAIRIISANFSLALIGNLLFYVLLISLYLIKKKRLNFENKFGFAILLTLIFGIHMTDNDLLLLLIPLLAVFIKFGKAFWAKAFFVLAVITPLLRYTGFFYIGIVMLCALIVLSLLLFMGSKAGRGRNLVPAG